MSLAIFHPHFSIRIFLSAIRRHPVRTLQRPLQMSYTPTLFVYNITATTKQTESRQSQEKEKTKLLSRVKRFVLLSFRKDCLVFVCLFKNHPPSCLNNCRSKLAKAPAIQKWIDGRIHEYCCKSKLPFYLPVLYGESIKSQ